MPSSFSTSFPTVNNLSMQRALCSQCNMYHFNATEEAMSSLRRMDSINRRYRCSDIHLSIAVRLYQQTIFSNLRALSDSPSTMLLPRQTYSPLLSRSLSINTGVTNRPFLTQNFKLENQRHGLHTSSSKIKTLAARIPPGTWDTVSKQQTFRVNRGRRQKETHSLHTGPIPNTPKNHPNNPYIYIYIYIY